LTYHRYVAVRCRVGIDLRIVRPGRRARLAIEEPEPVTLPAASFGYPLPSRSPVYVGIGTGA
jgi:hypothetical protein